MKEGSVSTVAYLVVSGEIKITSSELPRLLNVKTDFMKGYFSSTVNSFQLGKVCKNDWAGLEMLVFENRPIPFSLIACTKVELYKVSRSQLYSFPDIYTQLERFATEKVQFLKQRAKDISMSMKKMSKLENALSYSKEIAKEVNKRYPQANKAVLNNMKK